MSQLRQDALPFSDDGASKTYLPSPKLTARTRTGLATWTRFMPAFSADFALTALSLLSPKSEGLLYDPFVGSGTTLVAASIKGMKAIGNDLDPFSALISRAKLSINVDWKRAKHYLEGCRDSTPMRFAAEVFDYFKEDDLEYAGGVMSAIEHSLPKTDSLFTFLISDYEGRFDTETISLATLVSAAKLAATILRGSNPVWYRRAIGSEISKEGSLKSFAFLLLDRFRRDLLELHRPKKGAALRVFCQSFEKAPLGKQSVDHVLTSPPYVSRIDYVINHLPELMLLRGVHSIDISTLRRSMVGTTTVSEKHKKPNLNLGPKCLNFLADVRAHRSYASARYYHPFYEAYFHDIAQLFSTLRYQCKIGGSGLMVVQDSYYKDIPVPLGDIFCEIASNFDVNTHKLTSHSVKTHLGQISPKQMAYAPSKKLKEWVLQLQF